MADAPHDTRPHDLAIETNGLGKRYGAVAALVDLDLTVPAGTVFGFLGPNGAGKTTAMKLLVGLAAPTSGPRRVLSGRLCTRAPALGRASMAARAASGAPTVEQAPEEEP